MENNSIINSPSGPEFEESRSVSLKVVSIMMLILVETVGNGLLFMMAMHEKYGQDSKKRTIINILLSHICKACIAYNILSLPFLTMSIGFWRGKNGFLAFIKLCLFQSTLFS